ncbi:MAG: L,D-transpeptidase [Verrucomicrobiales bacterium]
MTLRAINLVARPKMKFFNFRLVPVMAAALVAGCASNLPSPRRHTDYLEGLTIPAPGRPAYTPVEDTFSYWEDDGSGGSPRLEIDLGEQAAYFFRGDHMVGRARISSGDESHPTPAGRFSVTYKDADHTSSLYGDFVDRETGEVVEKNIDVRQGIPRGCAFDPAKMHWYLQFYPATGMHSGYLPGYPASHGCIRLPDKIARRFFENASVGTPVIITR